MLKDLLEKEVKSFLLGEVCKIQRGRSFSSKEYRDEGDPILRVRNIQDNQLCTDGLVYFSPEECKKDLSKVVIKHGDIGVTTTGERCMAFLSQVDGSFYMNADICRIDPSPELIDKEYLFYFLLDLDLEPLIGGGVIPHLDIGKLKKVKVPIPSLSVQREIASKLGKFREIEREISLRDKQYEYYRNYLIMGSQGKQ
ncbi:type I restriction-modification system, S subunit [Mycoplasma haemofelis str. Langford 1]|uniref:Type I restriction enzyme specificity HsdS domain protein n=2 Tax=Mycoplasma haemofelis TaxID=29501 RepID=F6FIJ1_MYCHI|nr:restriction endonuclease subunit S [Mycoplasma haemofelis]AEG73039.1 type I restriction enzyme specificity HsdS domain protein [Mycoplasma haemofelis Ohio2]CBY92705.1 type I restriction-modification system, S subunit [Mycoplasma haemofelis str. Langford 1]